MQGIVVQIGVRHSRAVEVARSNGSSISIGRGFSNDVIISDPFVSPNQIRLIYLEQKWFAEILDHTNPILLNGQAVVDKYVEIKSADRLTIGRTTLTVFSQNHQVEATRKLIHSSSFLQRPKGLILTILAVLLVSFLDGFFDYLQFSIKHEWKDHLMTMLTSSIIIFCWAGIWSVTGRLLRHQPHFTSQLLTTTIMVGILIIVIPIGNYIEYIANSVLIGDILGYITTFLVLFILLKFNLFFATNIQNCNRTSLMVSGTLILLVLAISHLSKRDFKLHPTYSKTIKPPIALATKGRSIDDYINSAISEIKTIKFEEDE